MTQGLFLNRQIKAQKEQFVVRRTDQALINEITKVLQEQTPKYYKFVIHTEKAELSLVDMFEEDCRHITVIRLAWPEAVLNPQMQNPDLVLFQRNTPQGLFLGGLLAIRYDKASNTILFELGGESSDPLIVKDHPAAKELLQNILERINLSPSHNLEITIRSR